MVSQRGILNLIHSDPQRDAFVRRGNAMRLSGADVTIVERGDLALVSIATPQGSEKALATALQAGFGLAPPTATVSTTGGETRAVRTAPDQMFLIFPHGTPDANGQIQNKLGGTGYTTDQTDVWIALEISGPNTLTALERLCPLDLARMPANGAARTVMEHKGAMIIRLGQGRFLLMSASSSAGSFLNAVETSYRYVVS